MTSGAAIPTSACDPSTAPTASTSSAGATQIVDLLQRLHETRFLGRGGKLGLRQVLADPGRTDSGAARRLSRAGSGPLAGRQDEARRRTDREPRARALCEMVGPEPKAGGGRRAGGGDRRLSRPGRPRSPEAASRQTDANLLLLVDQFEEIFAFRGRAIPKSHGGRSPAKSGSSSCAGSARRPTSSTSDPVAGSSSSRFPSTWSSRCAPTSSATAISSTACRRP